MALKKPRSVALNLRFLALIAVIVAVAVYLFAGFPGQQPGSDSDDVPPAGSAVPAKAREVLDYIDAHHRPPEGYEGGRTFHNLGDGGRHPLPTTDDSGRLVRYREWDIYPKHAGRNRGPERLVTGSDGSAYYTADHYRSFTRIR
jgi:guanyl-specific ribonuclease Sa